MQVIYAQEQLPTKITKSIFLAGPTPRTTVDVSWRKLALNILYNMGYDGLVIIPEPKEDGTFSEITKGDGYEKQVLWEDECLNAADRIVFWIPRNMNGMPGLTTNDEWGKWKNSGKAILGYPLEAEKVRYQDLWAKKLNVPVYNNLYLTLAHAVKDLTLGAERINAEVKIPIDIWNHKAFKDWYNMLKANNNTLDDIKVLWQFYIPKINKLFSFIVKPKVYISAEDRYKDNEFFFGRTDISSCVIYSRPDNNILNTEIVIVSEYRVPVKNSKGLVYELPGGSSPKDEDPLQTVADEIKEETGIFVEKERLQFITNKQLQSTTLSHNSHLFALEIDQYEMELIKSRVGTTYGKTEDTELTYLNVMSLGDIIKSDFIDYSSVGMIMTVLLNEQ